MTIAKADFDYICELVKSRSGIVLETGKEYLVEARMTMVLAKEKIDSIATLVNRMKADATDTLRKRVIEAMTTNETSFFRDHHPFEMLKKTILPELMAKRAASKSISIWCAASSTGQEPYTIAMTLFESVPELLNWKITFIATDLSSEMIARSKQGKYNQIEINRGLPAPLMVKYFEKQGLEWQIKQPLRQLIDFREMNLTTPWPALPAMDIIFMRNVLIYFDDPTKKQILQQAQRLLRPDGYLFLGCAESTLCIPDVYTRMTVGTGSCFRLKSASVQAA